jgi:hypothetical protein
MTDADRAGRRGRGTGDALGNGFGTESSGLAVRPGDALGGGFRTESSGLAVRPGDARYAALPGVRPAAATGWS